MSPGQAISASLDGPLCSATRRAVDYAMPAFPGGLHQGLASPWLTLVISLAGPVAVDMPDRSGSVRHTEFNALVGGLCPAAVQLPMVGEQRGIQIDISPLEVRRILGLPAGEIAYRTVDLVEIFGRSADWLGEQLRAEANPRRRLRMVGEVLNQRMVDGPSSPIRAELRHAWKLLGQHQHSISDVGDKIGWSRRHLTQQFTREFGIGPKVLSRIARFDHAVALIRGARSGGLADIAINTGYTDQAHFSAEWRTMAGCSPTEWIRREFPFLPDRD